MIGRAIARLVDVDLDMWEAQDALYEVRRMTYEEYLKKYGAPEGAREVWSILKRACDLNLKRNDAIDALDLEVVERLGSLVT